MDKAKNLHMDRFGFIGKNTLGKIYSTPSTVYVCLPFCGLTACGISVLPLETELTSLVLEMLSPNRDCCCSVTKSYPTLCNPMDCSMPGFPVLHYVPEFAQTHVHWVDDTIQPSHPLLPSSPPAFNPSQHQGLFQWVRSSHQVAKVLLQTCAGLSWQPASLLSKPNLLSLGEEELCSN